MEGRGWEQNEENFNFNMERERERERVTENAIFTCSSLVVVFLLKASPGIGP